MPQTKYARCGDLSLAYQVVGDGPIDLVVASSFISHIELAWTVPQVKAWYDQLTSFSRVLVFDKAGVGLSDPVPKVRSLDDRATEIEAVMDAAGFDSAVIMGISEGGPASILFAATRPGRVQALILAGTFAVFPFAGWDDLSLTPDEIVEHVRATFGDAYTPSAEQVARLLQMGPLVRSNWGTGEALQILLPSVKSLAQLGMLERMSASPGMARATVEAVFRIDVRSVLTTVSVPTLVIHATGDPIPVQGGRYLADHIPGARLLEVDGQDHAPFLTEPDRISRAMEEFLTGTHGASRKSDRALKTVLFSDIVSSTARAAAMGDERWRVLLQRFDELTTGLVDRFCGTRL